MQWEEPFKVVKKLSSTSYMVEEKGRRKGAQIYHFNLLECSCMQSRVIDFVISVP